MRGWRCSSCVAIVASTSSWLRPSPALSGRFCGTRILHRVEASEFFVDAPLSVMPASWQDTGSGVFTVAVAVVLLGFGPARREAARRVALLCGLAAFLVDVYLY